MLNSQIEGGRAEVRGDCMFGWVVGKSEARGTSLTIRIANENVVAVADFFGEDSDFESVYAGSGRWDCQEWKFEISTCVDDGRDCDEEFAVQVDLSVVFDVGVDGSIIVSDDEKCNAWVDDQCCDGDVTGVSAFDQGSSGVLGIGVAWGDGKRSYWRDKLMLEHKGRCIRIRVKNKQTRETESRMLSEPLIIVFLFLFLLSFFPVSF
jgi:hypothetical protein